jgi:NADH:ubiquinone oxidoreductase subunit 3 (subunit A)
LGGHPKGGKLPKNGDEWPILAVPHGLSLYSLSAKRALASNNRSLKDVQQPYLDIVVIATVALIFALTPLLLARLWAKKFSPQKTGPQKNAIYECGLEAKPTGWVQFKTDYYIYAIIFLIFDVETIFLLPFAVAFTGLSVGGFVAMMIFLLLLVEGLVWACAKGVLTWK